jgi:transcriptional regulator with XRE-family HTH domain
MKRPNIDSYANYRRWMAAACLAQRQRLGLSQAQVAEMVPCSQMQIARIENPDCLSIDPRLSMLTALAYALELDLGLMLGDPWRDNGKPLANPEPFPLPDGPKGDPAW